MNILLSRGGLLLAAATLSALGLAQPGFGQTLTDFPLARARSLPFGVAVGPGGDLWFTEAGRGAIGRISKDGVLSEVSVPTPYAELSGIAAGPDGNIWFTGADFDSGTVSLIGRITPGGAIKEFPLSGLSIPCQITAG